MANITQLTPPNELYAAYRDDTAGLPFLEKVERHGLTAALAGHAVKRGSNSVGPLIVAIAITETFFRINIAATRRIQSLVTNDADLRNRAFDNIGTAIDYANMALHRREGLGIEILATATWVEHPSIVEATEVLILPLDE
jgi:hypothetical protein